METLLASCKDQFRLGHPETSGLPLYNLKPDETDLNQTKPNHYSEETTFSQHEHVDKEKIDVTVISGSKTF